MALYEVTNESLEKIPATSFVEERLLERQDLQRLLKANIGVIDPDVLVIAEEFGEWSEGNRRIDLLAVDREANLVVIELKRDDVGGHMELQAIRYAAMISNMTWDQAIESYQEYLLENDSDIDANASLCEFLKWSEPNQDEFGQNVRIVLASADFSTEITNTVLWLNERDLDIRCVKLSLHKLDGRLLLSAEQTLPLKEAQDYQIEVRQKRREERASRTGQKDRSKFTLVFKNEVYEEGFRKSDIGYFTVKLLEAKGLIDDDAFEFLKNDRSSSFNLLKQKPAMTDTEKRYSKYRHTQPPELNYKGQGYYIARNWGKDNILGFMDKMKERFPAISYSSTSD